MLKGLDPLLGPDLLRVLRAMGHGDEIAIVDGNYPAETDGHRLIRMDGHDAVSVANAILSVMPLDEMVPDAAFRPGIAGAPGRREPIFAEFEALVARHEPGKRIAQLDGPAFYERVRAAFAIVATSERRLYGNLVLRKGVIHPAPERQIENESQSLDNLH
ncbi:L-fucose mutarotase [Hartmannibacter diazotrophicus]|uniref:L-fucose mutarotase n=1 Tax=Hartmannibacter diazotrophicus TaxID=1482074 RepID=A0A2C9D4J1_9HYPH|nr:RbsD/FucU domain-containing protein [Hartmannibacter diazotrophicus]SON55120.1 L-fucose mutarotase [Hartmannibacter diazotrophicus]